MTPLCAYTQDGPVLREALRRYVTRWLPLVKEALGQGIELAPPVDIAWLWHVHRLSPLGYHEDCMSLAGKPLHADAGTNPFAFDADADGRSPTRTMWETLFPEEPFVNRFLSGYPTAAPANADSLPALGDAAPCNLRVDIVSSVQRQSGFLWQARPHTERASGPAPLPLSPRRAPSRPQLTPPRPALQVSYGQGYYGTEDFLQAGLLRYRQLMHLMGNHRDVFLVRPDSHAPSSRSPPAALRAARAPRRAPIAAASPDRSGPPPHLRRCPRMTWICSGTRTWVTPGRTQPTA